MGTRHPNPRLVKIHRNYSVPEIALLFGVHKNTVRRWLKEGLEAIEGKGPTLVIGRVLRAFIEQRRQKAKRPCPPGFMYCLRCRAPKEPAGRMADLICTNERTGNLRGLCPDCEAMMHRRVSLARIHAIRGDLEITVPGAAHA
jgi:hypothetical protein